MPTKSFFERKSPRRISVERPELIFDQGRTRTAWFEGQHVTADQFNRDQSYNITRLADMGRTIGRGVVEGFDVTAPKPTVLRVEEGLGLAASGEVIHLPVTVDLDLADIPTQRRLNATLKAKGGFSPRPETRTGLFVLGASIVEQTSNPIASYPVSLNSERSLQDSVINEAVLFTLTPVPVPITRLDEEDWQAMAAYRIFIEGEEAELPPGALPLAMVAIAGNAVTWVDVPMVRRSLSSNAGRDAGLGLVDESRRAAHFEQFDAVMEDVLKSRPGQGMPASDIVRALPAMGRLPVASVARRAEPSGPVRLSQNWLPASTLVELIALPRDEIEALLRESVHLPPIDLSAKDEVHANTPVSIIVPVAREDWMQTPAEVAEAAVPLKAPPAVGGTPTAPEDLLHELLNGVPAPSPSDSLATDAWAALLGQATELWYVRRRQFQRSDLAMNGIVIPVVEVPDGGGPDLPDVPPVDLEPFVNALFPVVRNAYSDMKADDLVEVFFDGEEQDRLMMVQHQMLLLDQKAYTHMMAAAMELIEGAINPAGLMEKFRPVVPKAFNRFEYAIMGAEVLMRVNPSEVQSNAGAAGFFTGLFDFGSFESETLVKNMLPITVNAGGLGDPDRLTEILQMVREFNGNVDFLPADPFSDRVMAARRRLAECRRLFDISALMEGLNPNQAASVIPKMLSVFQDPGLEREDLGNELFDTLEGSL